MTTKTITVEDVLLETEEKVYSEDLSNEDKAILNNIDTLINELRGRGVTGKDFRLYSADELSRIAGSLALLKDSLVDILAKTGRKKRVQEALLKLNKGNLRQPAIDALQNTGIKKPTVDDIKSYIEKRLFRTRIKFAFLEELSEKMVYKWRAINSLLDVIQNRIHVLQSQQADVQTQNNSLAVDLDLLDNNEN